MPRGQKRIRDLKAPSKNSTVYQKLIDSHGWVPYGLGDSEGLYWDLSTVRDAKGQVNVAISEVARRQKILLIQSGHFGDQLKEVYVDEDRYSQIRDALITWPNPKAITEEGLHAVAVVRRHK